MGGPLFPANTLMAVTWAYKIKSVTNDKNKIFERKVLQSAAVLDDLIVLNSTLFTHI